MSVPKTKYITAEEYLGMERHALIKSEYYKGEVFAMSGASIQHNKISTNLIRFISTFLKGKSCEIYGSDLRIHIPSNSLFTYPDASIICGKIQVLDHENDTVLNPS